MSNDITTQQLHVTAKEMHIFVNYGFAKDIVSHFNVLELELANIYYKKQDSQYFKLYGSCSLCCNFSALLLSVKAVTDNM